MTGQGKGHPLSLGRHVEVVQSGNRTHGRLEAAHRTLLRERAERRAALPARQYGLPPQVRIGDAPQRRKRVVWSHGDDDLPVGQMVHFQVLVRDVVVNEGQVRLAVQDVLDALLGGVLGQLDVDVGVGGAEIVDRLRGKRPALRYAQHDRVKAHARPLGALARDGAGRILGQVEHGRPLFIEHLSRRRRGDAALPTGEKLAAQLPLELLDGRGYSLLRDEQPLGRRRVRPLLACLAEVPQLPQLHAARPHTRVRRAGHLPCFP